MPARARTGDPDTSHEAAASITEAHLSAAQTLILSLIRAHGPLADHELDAAYERQRGLGLDIQISPSGVRTRRRELVDAGLVEQHGDTLSPTGRRAFTWRAADYQPAIF